MMTVSLVDETAARDQHHLGIFKKRFAAPGEADGFVAERHVQELSEITFVSPPAGG
ncbi:hypothetical protein [Nonomuraea sp. NPDC048916]|uniref:hypothetical protein n=1 Tax=Nonomuraea sp. NPDC048916 TaxID=3154232 RepID=UPI0033C6C50C